MTTWLQTPARFLIAGAANSLATFLLYQVLVGLMSASAAYAAAWALGLVIVALAYPRAVFRTGASAARRLSLVVSYAGTFAVGLLLTSILELTGFNPRLIIVLVMTVTTGANYLMSHLLLARSPGEYRREASGHDGSTSGAPTSPS